MRRAAFLRRTGLGTAAACGAASYAFARSDGPGPEGGPAIYQKAGFDPTALEQVAAAARTSKAQLDLALGAATTAQRDERDKSKQYTDASKRLAAEARDARRREDEKTRRDQAQHEAQRSQYRSSLAHERDLAATRLDETLKDGEEAARVAHDERMESIRRESAEFEASLRKATDAKYVEARAFADALVERDTHDLKLAMLKSRGAEARKAAVDAVGAVLASAGAAVQALLKDEQRMVALAGVVTAAALGVAVARHGTRVIARQVEAHFRKPALVRETSRGLGVATTVPGGAAFARLVQPSAAVSAATLRTAILEGAAFEPKLEATLLRIAQGAAKTRENQAPFRHVLLHGPPGTGKTLFAKRLATRAGLDFAIASGGDVAPLGRDAVTQIHKLFDWAKTSPRGLVLLIDEADAFVRSRSSGAMSEDARNALNAFLYRTGSPDSHTLVVFATNAPELFDAAIHDRVDDVVHFGNPALPERLKILQHHLDTFTSLPDLPLKLEGVDPSHVLEAARKTDGFSARQVSKLALAWRAAAFGSKTPVLSPQLMADVLNDQLEQVELKRKWHIDSTTAPA